MTRQEPGTGHASAAAALERVRSAPPERPFVVAQLGQTLDGRIATPTGESRWINGEAALDHVHRLRAAVDAVVVGIGTALADDPLLSVRRVTGRNPARVIIDPRGRLPATAKCLNVGDGARQIVIVAAEAVPAPVGRPSPSRGGAGGPTGVVEAVAIQRDASGQLPPSAIVAALHARGLKRLLIEGGAGTVSGFIAAGAVDRLHVLVAPLILGSGTTGLSLPPIARLADALRPPTEVHVLADGDVLFDCDLRSVQTRS